MTARRGRVAVRLRGWRRIRAGVGSMIVVRGGTGHTTGRCDRRGDVICRENQALRTFATGTSKQLDVEVQWASGKRSVLAGVLPGMLLEVDETMATPGAAPKAERISTRLFEDVSSRLGHVHEDQPFDDFERQPLLPNRLSQLGPGVSWVDFNQDGLPDLVVGTGRGGRIGVFQNAGNGSFQRVEGRTFGKPAGRDLTTVLPIQGNLIAGSSHFEDGTTNGGYLRIFDPVRLASGESVLGPQFAVGPLAAADVDGDGTLELFVGGRSIAGRYPEPADSLLLQNRGGRFWSSPTVSQSWVLVSGAVFTDFDGDGDSDLVLACEWGAR